MLDALSIRDLTASDVDAAVRIALAAWQPIQEHYRQVLGDALFDATRGAWRSDRERAVRAACAGTAGQLALVAQMDDLVVGFLTAEYDVVSGVGTFTNNAVDPAWQGRGIGSRLYAAALQRLRSLGMRYARVTTGSDDAHAAARRAYEKAGFQARLGSVEYYCSLQPSEE